MNQQLLQALMGAMPGGSNGATPPTWEGPGMNEMMGGLRKADQQEALAMALLGKNNQTGGWGGVASALLGGIMGKKQLGKANALRQDTMGKLDGYEANQAMRKQFQEHQQGLQAAKAKEQEYQRGRSDKAEDRQAQLENQKTMAQFNAGLRPTPQNETSTGDLEARYLQNLAQTNPEQFQQIMASRVGGGQTQAQPYSPEEQRLIDNGAITPELIDQSKVNKITGEKPETSTQKAEKQAVTDYMTTIDRLDSMIAEHGTEFGGKTAKEMETLYNQLTLQGKDVFKLGILSADDRKILESLAGDPTGLGAQFNPWAAGNIRTQLATLKSGVQSQGGGQAQSQSPQDDDALLSKYL